MHCLWYFLVFRLNVGYMCFQSLSGTVHPLLTTCGIRPTFRAVPTKHSSMYHEVTRDYPSTFSTGHRFYSFCFCCYSLLEVTVYNKIYIGEEKCIYIVGPIAQALLAYTSQWAANTWIHLCYLQKQSELLLMEHARSCCPCEHRQMVLGQLKPVPTHTPSLLCSC